MTDVSAQAFREAAALEQDADNFQTARYLLAAAEQREQWDVLQTEYRGVCNICLDMKEQIATLTAERDALKAGIKAFTDQLVAERDEARAMARQAANGWACDAKRKIEHDDISRIHKALDALEAK